MTLRVLDPIASAERLEVAEPPPGRPGQVRRIAVVDNHKANAYLLLTWMVERLERRGGYEAAGEVRKPQASVPADPERLQSLVGMSGAALAGTAD
jgi:hypothetical protein